MRGIGLEDGIVVGRRSHLYPNFICFNLWIVGIEFVGYGRAAMLVRFLLLGDDPL